MKNKSEKDRISAVLFIIVFLLVVVIVIMVLKTLDKDTPEEEQTDIPATQNYQPPVADPNQSGLVIADPVVTPNPYQPVNALPGTGTNTGTTQTPGTGTGTGNTGNTGTGNTGNTGVIPVTAPTTAPATAPTPVPTPAPTAAPTGGFTPAPLGGNEFESDTGTGLNIKAKWSARAINETQVEVTVSVVCMHQTLHTGFYNPVNIMVDDQYFTTDAKRIDSNSYDLQETEIASTTFTVELPQGTSRTFWVAVEWEYGGTYSGVKLDTIKCGQNITLTR